MKISSILALGLGLAFTASGYVITMYKKENCAGDSTERNVYDNTCAPSTFDAMSVRIDTFGGSNQNARFYSKPDCLAGSEMAGPWRADKENDPWKKGACLDVKGQVIKSYGSRLG
ncbi:hypothetical protein CMUS01_13051 [Colletotrichum musicola]|uniref:Uncharacterized protein n=1 Tax=Colletotrichum musicola TaxID=2175873 RepID=A0A8H6MY36_9PEZI|nr:hypothetical protein CMUS01_13051 [Colletotrichum musicola]